MANSIQPPKVGQRVRFKDPHFGTRETGVIKDILPNKGAVLLKSDGLPVLLSVVNEHLEARFSEQPGQLFS